MLRLKRVYEPVADDDGYRVLVDRLWPRGLRKQDAHLDAWDQELAPSAELRKWFGHDPDKWAGFQKRYRAELEQGEAPEHLRALARRAAEGPVTLLYSAHDPQHNNAVVLRAELSRRLKRRAPGQASPRRRKRTRTGEGEAHPL